MMSTSYLYRALQAVLAELQGTPSSGEATFRSTSGTVSLPAGTFAIPIIDDHEEERLTVKIERNPDTTDGSWLCTTSGASVSVTTLQGGASTAISAGTLLRLDPPVAGLGEFATAGAISEGEDAAEYGTLRQVRCYKDLGEQATSRDFFNAQLADYPAACITWLSTTPADGSTTASLGPNTVRAGAGKRLYQHQFAIFLVGSRLDHADRRRRELDMLRDNLLELVTDRVAWRDLVLSAPRGLRVDDVRKGATTPTSYIDVVLVSALMALQRTEARSFGAWSKTRLQATAERTRTDSGAQVAVTVVDATDSMPE